MSGPAIESAFNAPFPEDLRDPVDAETATVRPQDLFFILSQRVDLGLLSIASAFRASRDLTGRFVVVVVLVLESEHVDCSAKWNCTHVSGWGC
jgi:hypothetical protein